MRRLRREDARAVSMLASAALGGLAVQGLHAQAKPPVYYIAEIDVTNPDAYAKEYAPKGSGPHQAASVGGLHRPTMSKAITKERMDLLKVCAEGEPHKVDKVDRTRGRTRT